jgi:uncharacterized sporulation protein YeaH/YhbH (DUF444 family)
MTRKIRKDQKRFEEIVRGEAREELLERVQQGQMRGITGDGDQFVVPVDSIYVPEFRRDPKGMGGVGQGGDVEEGEPIDEPGDEEGEGDEAGKGGSRPTFERTVPQDLFEEAVDDLGLKYPEPKGEEAVRERERRISDMREEGPDAMRMNREWILNAIKEKRMQIGTEYDLTEIDGVGDTLAERIYEETVGVYTPEAPQRHNLELANRFAQQAGPQEVEFFTQVDQVSDDLAADIAEYLKQNTYIPGKTGLEMREDQAKYFAEETVTDPDFEAVVFYLRDCSGSMRGERTDAVIDLTMFINRWLDMAYDEIHHEYILYNWEAWEADKQEFYTANSGGGTRLSAGIQVMDDRIGSGPEQYDPSKMNIYGYNFSDGGNWSGDTADEYIPVLEDLLDVINHYGDVEILSYRDTSQHMEEMQDWVGSNDVQRVDLAEVEDTDDYSNVLESLFGQAEEAEA